MEFPLGALLLLSLGPALTRENNTTVTQTEDFEVFEGDTATLQCCLRSQCNVSNWRVVWTRRDVVVGNMNDKGSCASYTKTALTCCDNLTLPNFTRDHEGLYVCKITIDIPRLEHFQGKGTMVTTRLTGRACRSPSPQWFR
ncbi:hypothetical protein CRUP_023444 [Coryphaenoides rupestris]|nr:hypothetical protein CRUP_023444 [Coryphaenoides rupestris]